MKFKAIKVDTQPFEGQKPGTSGLRKKTKDFMQPNYVENFVQSIFDSLPTSSLRGCMLIVGGDGRFYNDRVLQIIIRLSAANHIGHLIIGQHGIFSTPAVSALIRKKSALGGIILTASHNPGGVDEDFGMKFNGSNGGPASETFTDHLFEKTKQIQHYWTTDIPEIDLGDIRIHDFDGFKVEIIDPVDDYLKLMKEIFDFQKIRDFFTRNPSFKMLFNGMHGVTGPYAKRMFLDELGLPKSVLMNCEPKQDFGNKHPDPNLTYAADLVIAMEKGDFDFGAASDGDGDRNMILGKNCFVNPSDSVAIIAAQAMCIPYFSKNGIQGLARSMPTSMALDRVASRLGVACYEVPTGWKYFGNLMDAHRLSICGEESFGTGSNHIREKDGLWAVLAWLSIIAHHNGKSIREILEDHWRVYGRNFFCRYDYEDLSAKDGAKIIEHLSANLSSWVGTSFGSFRVSLAENFEYHDPIDQSISRQQGIRILFETNSRIVYRLSGTGSTGATLRIYIEHYESNSSGNIYQSSAEALKDLTRLALQLCNLQVLTGRSSPTVIT